MVEAKLTDVLKDAVPLAAAARELFTPPRHASAVHRYVYVGILVDGTRVKLRVWKSGGIVVTTPAAVEEFLQALNVPQPEQKPARDANPSPRDKKTADAKFSQRATDFGKKNRELDRSRRSRGRKPARVG